MDLVSTILESMNMDPMKVFEESDPYDYFQGDGNLFLEETLNEAESGATKENVLSKIWAFIKKCLNWIAKQWSRFIAWCKKVFFGKKGSKSADQIAGEIVGENQEGEINGEQMIPSNPDSKVEPPNFDEVIKPLLCSFNSDKKTIILTYKDIKKNEQRFNMLLQPVPNKIGKVPTKSIVRLDDVIAVHAMVMNSDLIDNFVEVCKIVETRELVNNDFVQKFLDFEKLYDKAVKQSKQARSDGVFEIPLNKLDEFNLKMVEANKAISALSEFDAVDQKGMGLFSNAKPYDSANVVFCCNKIANLTAIWQMGITGIIGCMKSVYQIDKTFMGTIGDIENLSIFAQKCVESGIPGKYVMWNCYKISKSNLKGNGKGNDGTKPIWGQSRFVFFPSDNPSVVHKVAYNPWGLRANQTEISVSSKLTELGKSDIIAKITSQSQNQYVVDMERTDSNDKPDISTCMDIRNKLMRISMDNNLKVNFANDIHQENVRKVKGKWACIDYGAGTRY